MSEELKSFKTDAVISLMAAIDVDLDLAESSAAAEIIRHVCRLDSALPTRSFAGITANFLIEHIYPPSDESMARLKAGLQSAAGDEQKRQVMTEWLREEKNGQGLSDEIQIPSLSADVPADERRLSLIKAVVAHYGR